jgi:hypothetical protein
MSIPSIADDDEEYAKEAGSVDEYISILSLAKFESDKFTIKGTYRVVVPGTYILWFDNSFSINTSKRVTFYVTATSDDFRDPAVPKPPQVSGWLLKKKRKKMQGWARRWFQLDQDHILSYYSEPNSYCRGSIDLLNCVVNKIPEQRMFVLDADRDHWKLKAVDAESYDYWFTRIVSKLNLSVENADLKVDSPISSKSSMRIKSNDNLKSGSSLAVLRSGVSLADVLIGLSFTGDIQSLQKILGTIDSEVKNIQTDVDRLRELLSENPSNQNPQIYVSEIDRLLVKIDSGVQTNSANIRKQENVYKELNQKLLSYKNSIDTVYLSLLMEFNHLKRKFLSGKSECSEDEFFDAMDEVDEELALNQEQELVEDDNVIIDNASTDDDDNDLTEVVDLEPVFTRRKELPSEIVGEDLSLTSLITNIMGKDLSTVTMPVATNEPLSMLQRMCEEVEYCYLLRKANEESVSLDRLMYITAFVVSSQAFTFYRSSRKPFNPLLGETFEYVRPDLGFRYISEKVCHHPLTIASHASIDEGKILYWQCIKPRTKFWGKSFELVNQGMCNIELAERNERYTFSKPKCFVRNAISGPRYLEYTGEIKITNESTGEYSVIEYLSSGYSMFSSSNESNTEIRATVYNHSGEKHARMSGKWNEVLYKVVSPEKFEILWKMNAMPAQYQKYYGFTYFAIELNEKTPDTKPGAVAYTDSRFRPDQSLLERGDLERAEDEKNRVENKQRKKRKEGNEEAPKWFQKQDDDSFVFSGSYWDVKKNNGFERADIY